MHLYFIVFYSAALTIALLHLAASALIMRKKFKSVPVQSESGQKFEYPKISILKPLKGMDDNLEENLRSFFNLDYPDYEIIFGLQSSADPAARIALKLLGEFDHIRAKIVIDSSEIGLNPKINNLHNMTPQIRGSYLFISDSNTAAAPDLLNRLMTEFKDKSVGLVTATIRGTGEQTIASAMENLHLNSFVTPNVFAADTLTGIPIVIGKSILISRALLEQVGGFPEFKDYLAEDHLLGLKVKEAGYKNKCAPVFVDNINRSWSLERFINRHTRWAKMRRHMHLHHYIIESLSNPITLSFILFLLLPNWAGLLQLFIISTLKIVHDIYILKLLKKEMEIKYIALIPLKDLLMSILWILPFFSSRLTWRENKFKIKKKTFILRTT